MLIKALLLDLGMLARTGNRLYLACHALRFKAASAGFPLINRREAPEVPQRLHQVSFPRRARPP
ncbi:MAG: hypothetical protein ACOYO0_11185 [Sandarakinorhabdus sp.]|jgi:hypothetical protein